MILISINLERSKNSSNLNINFTSNVSRDISHLSTKSDGNNNNKFIENNSFKADNFSLKFRKNQSEDFYTNEKIDGIEKTYEENNTEKLENIIIEENSEFYSDYFLSEVNQEDLNFNYIENNKLININTTHLKPLINQNNYRDKNLIFNTNDNGLYLTYKINKKEMVKLIKFYLFSASSFFTKTVIIYKNINCVENFVKAFQKFIIIMFFDIYFNDDYFIIL